MAVIRIVTRIAAPMEWCFDLARDIDFHTRSLADTGERAVAGRTTGLIGLGDDGTILLSGKINDREGLEKMIFADRKARWPGAASRPHPRYLAWHRERFELAV